MHFEAWRVYTMYPQVLPLWVDLDPRVMYTDCDTGEETLKPTHVAEYFGRPTEASFDQLTFKEYMGDYLVCKSPAASRVAFRDQLGRTVVRRARGGLLCRLQSLMPHNGEQFYLKMILESVPLRSLQDARTTTCADGTRTIHGTLRAAALARGLFTEESEYELVFQETVKMFAPRVLRRLLVQVSLQGANGLKISQDHYAILSDDVEGGTADERYVKFVHLVHDIFEDHGKDAESFGFPPAQVLQDPARDVYDPAVQRATFEATVLDAAQQRIVDRCVAAMEAPGEKTVVLFLDAPAGHGKTHVAKAITAKLRSLKFHVNVVAPTALAASLHEGGQTAHRSYGLPVSDDDHIQCTQKAMNRWAKRDLSRTAHLWDEAPNAHVKNLAAVDDLFRSLRDPLRPWGGVPLVVMLGDFRQVPPVVANGNDFASIHASVKMSTLWATVETIKLVKNYRQEDSEYGGEVLRIGNGHEVLDPRATAAPYLASKPGHSFVPVPTETTYSVDEAIDFAYPSLAATVGGDGISEHDVKHCALLCARNKHVDEINDQVQKLVSAKQGTTAVTLYSKDTKDVSEELNRNTSHFSHQFLEQLNADGCPPHKLVLQVVPVGTGHAFHTDASACRR